MISKKSRRTERKNKQNYKGKPHIRKIITPDQVGFHNLKTNDVWHFSRLRDGASPVRLVDQQITFNLPTMTQICYPGQTIRISTGWKLENLPADNAMFTYPSTALLNADVVGMTQLYTQALTGGQLTTTLLNSGTTPIVFEVNVAQSQFEVYRVDKNGEIQNLTDFNWGQFAKAALTTASHILPIFI